MSAVTITGAMLAERIRLVHAAVVRRGGHAESSVLTPRGAPYAGKLRPFITDHAPQGLTGIFDDYDELAIRWELPGAVAVPGGYPARGECLLCWEVAGGATRILHRTAPRIYGDEVYRLVRERCVVFQEWIYEDPEEEEDEEQVDEYLVVEHDAVKNSYCVRLIGSADYSWDRLVVGTDFDSFMWHWAELGFIEPARKSFEPFLDHQGLLDSRGPEGRRWRRFLFGEARET